LLLLVRTINKAIMSEYTDCGFSLSYGKRMDLLLVVRTILERNPAHALRAKYLLSELEKRGFLRSTSYQHLSSFVVTGDIFREKGCYWLEDPQGASSRFQKAHSLQIASGLLSLTGGSKYTLSGAIAPDFGQAEHGLQHLYSGYFATYSLLLDNREVFRERIKGLVRSLEIGDERLKGFCIDCCGILGKAIVSSEENEIRKRLKLFE
jgi:hypothetical protein